MRFNSPNKDLKMNNLKKIILLWGKLALTGKNVRKNNLCS
jgi:hypothetical protein